jgi:hypothetical protein
MAAIDVQFIYKLIENGDEVRLSYLSKGGIPEDIPQSCVGKFLHGVVF